MVHKKACLLATGNNNSSHANCMNQVEGILTRFKYSLVYFEDGTRQYFCQWGGGGGGGRYGNSSANPTTPGPEFND